MLEPIQRMTQQQAWSGKPHDFLYFLPHLSHVTMYRTLLTGRLVI